MKKRHSIGTLISLIALTTMVGCGNSSRGEDITFDENGNLVASSGTTIHVWGYCDGEEESRMQTLINAFNDKYRDYNISARFTPYASSGWEQKMKATLSNQTGPDVFLTADQYYKQWVTLGYMENLDPYIKSPYKDLNMENELSNMFEGGVGRYLYDADTATSTSENAHYYGLPKGTGSTAIFYNKTYMKNANITCISVDEKDLEEKGYPNKAYFNKDGKWYFNNRIAMNWEECASLAKVLQNNPLNRGENGNGVKYGFFTSWWFNYAKSVGGDCIEYLPSDDSQYEGGYYTFSLADQTVNYKAKDTIEVNGHQYEKGQIISYEDKFFLDDILANKCDVLPSQRYAFSEYMSLSGKLESNHYYAAEVGVTDKFYQIIPYKLNNGGVNGYNRNNEIMKNEVTTFTPSENEKYGDIVTIYNKGISPNPSTISTEGAIGYFINGKTAMTVSIRADVASCREIDAYDWDVAPMLVYKEYDENNNLIVSGNKGAHSGSNAWCVWSKSKIKNASALFVKFATTNEGQRILADAGTIIPNQKDIADEFIKKDVEAGLKPQNLQCFVEGAEYQTPGDWWYLKDGDWIDGEGRWANYLNQTVRNYNATLEKFYATNDYKGTFELLKEYTKSRR